MPKSLVIVESPTKAKTIGKYLGKNFTVKASVGHIKDLPKGKLGVDVENGFSPTYLLLPSKKKVIDQIRKAAESANEIYLACDPDREGEAIAWHLAEEIQGKKWKGGKGTKKVHRILMHEITKNGVQEALKNPQELDQHLYEAQQARRILDRLVGYQISPLLWDKVRRGLSAGRVQSVAVRLICEREEEFTAFKPEEYWSIDFECQGSSPPPFLGRVVTFGGKKIQITSGDEAKRIVGEISRENILLKTIERKERRRHAPPPFITSRLQQDASQKLGFSAKKTMVLAQQLYEGVPLGEEGPIGLVTYMRTDSTRVSPSAIEAVRGYIHGQFGPSFIPPQPNFYRNKKAAQDAHEAIRPSSLNYPPERVRPYLDRDQFRLYELIWKRFVASQMESAVLDQTTFQMTAGDYGLRATGSQIKFSGFLAIYQIDRSIEEKEGEDEGDEEDRNLPALVEGEALKILRSLPEQHFTEPPPRYNEASLIKMLEEKGIGRPSTYAAIVSTIIDKEYVAKEAGKFTPTRLGVIVNKLLVENFPEILNVEFTAQMEGELDDVEEGKRHYAEALKDFYGPFEKTLQKAKKQMENIKTQEIKTDLVCEKCNSPMIVKWGRRGEFVACSNYPECKNTREFQWNKEGQIELAKREVTGEFCAQCGSQMVIKSGRFGRFLACPKYPECKTTRAVSIGVSCPVCKQGKVTEKRSRKGRTFYGCTAYPNCKFASWDKPIPEKCPECEAAFLVVKFKKTGEEIRCATKGCQYTRSTAASS